MRKSLLKNWFKQYTMLFVLFVLMMFFWLVAPSFLSPLNLKNLVVQNTYILVIAVGLAFVMMGGALDLSIGYQISAIGVLTGMLMTVKGIDPYLAMAAGLIFGMALGFINGALSVILKVHPIIVTVGTTTVFQGISYLISGGTAYSKFPPAFRVLTKGQILGVPVDVIIAIVSIIVGSFILNKTYYGRYIKAMGGNREATRLAGIKINSITVNSFMLSGFFAALATFILMSKQGVMVSSIGPGTEFAVLTAALLGGISFSTGEGKMWGLVTGVFILAVIGNGMQLAGWNQYVQYIIRGAVLLAALGFDMYQRFSKTKKSKKKESSD